MLSKQTRSILIGVGAVVTTWGLTFIGGNRRLAEQAQEYTTKIEEMSEKYEAELISKQNEISSLSEKVNRLSNIQFKFLYPSGMEFDIETVLKEENGVYYAESNIKSVTVNANMATAFNIEGSSYSLSLAEFDLLARTVRAETDILQDEANVATANVILHRVDSDLYPDTVSQVIHQPNQFEVVDNGSYYKEPTAKSIRAVAQALNGVDYVPNALGFWNASLLPAGHELHQYSIMYRIGEHVYSDFTR